MQFEAGYFCPPDRLLQATNDTSDTSEVILYDMPKVALFMVNVKFISELHCRGSNRPVNLSLVSSHEEGRRQFLAPLQLFGLQNHTF